jgi:hypothetical protein
MSPYAYCANNPVIFIDPTGKEIEIEVLTNNGRQSERYTYKNENGTYGFYNGKGELYSGGDEFVNALSKDLGTLVSGTEGKELVDGLINDKRTVSIQQASRSVADITNNIVGLSYSNESAMEAGGLFAMESYVKLGHELAHIEDAWKGTYDGSTWVDAISQFDKPISNAEKYATYRENQIRNEHGIPLRTHYSAIYVGSGVAGNANGWIGTAGTSILDSNGENRFFH